ncbi:MAG: sulfatase [Phycisphaerae bacterium]|jgi:arylsulfatase A-like enzyme
MRSRLSLIALLGAAALLAGCGQAGKRPPNVVIIYIDDMGYADIGPFGAQGYATPHLDRMAREGRRFTDFYVAQAVCSASRAALMTGCYNVRVGILGALGPNAEHGISSEETTLAEICKQRGYATAVYGKWHLGHHPKFLPTSHGFDEYFGLAYSNDMKRPENPPATRPRAARRAATQPAEPRQPFLPVFDGTDVINPHLKDAEQDNLTVWYTKRAVSFIERNKDRPFFLYVPHTMVHVPLHVSKRFTGKTGRGLFADVVAEVDWSVGEILEAIRRNGLESNTLVIFSTDNGPWLSYGDHAGSAGPLREGKGTMFDGGCRVPTLMWWPGTIPAGTECREPAMTIDILPTVARLIGARLPERKIDGRDIWPLIVGAPGATSPQEAYYFYWGEALHAVRMGRWKLHFPHPYRTLSGRPGGTGGRAVPYDEARIDTALFDLQTDPGETTDVKDRHPEVVARITALAERMRADLGDAARNMKGTGRREPGRLQPGEARFVVQDGLQTLVEAGTP